MHILAALTEGTTPPKTPVKEKGAEAILDFETTFMDVDAQTTSEGEVLLPTDVEVDPDPDHDVPDQAVLRGSNENNNDSVDATDITDLADLDLSGPELPNSVPAKPDPAPQNLAAQTAERPLKDIPKTATPVPQNAPSLVQNQRPVPPHGAEIQDRLLPIEPARTEPLVPSVDIKTPTLPTLAHTQTATIANQIPLAISQEMPVRTAGLEKDLLPFNQGKQTTPQLEQVKPAMVLPKAAAVQASGFSAVEINGKTKVNRPELAARSDEKGLSLTDPDPKAPQPVLQTSSAAMPHASAMPQTFVKQTKGETLDVLTRSELKGDVEEAPAISALSRSDGPSMQSPIQPAILQHPQMPQHIARQMAEVLQKGTDGPVDVALNPEELGKVRMRISLQDGGIMINIFAERGETLDLMRRNADLLSQEFKDLGFGSVNFGFDTSDGEMSGNSDDPSENTRSNETSKNTSPDVSELSVSTPQTLVTQGVDIRL
jgi:flagellar hook-length control protein FliK